MVKARDASGDSIHVEFQDGTSGYVKVCDSLMTGEEFSHPEFASNAGQAAVRCTTLVADLLGRVGLLERAGTGIERMRVEALSQGYPEPEFKEDTFVTVVFRPHPKILTDREQQNG